MTIRLMVNLLFPNMYAQMSIVGVVVFMGSVHMKNIEYHQIYHLGV